MKNSVCLFILILSLNFNLKSQIIHENDYPGSATLTDLALSGYKYYMMDAVNNQCKIYNTDHSLWKTILLDVPSGMYLYDIRYVSETLSIPITKSSWLIFSILTIQPFITIRITQRSSMKPASDCFPYRVVPSSR